MAAFFQIPFEARECWRMHDAGQAARLATRTTPHSPAPPPPHHPAGPSIALSTNNSKAKFIDK
ncbi:hypothetical protein E2C01_076307 [Portunus trituberculatus]|uniref:Uncharacterized protein n=1 Tax=Portunus trituberculatus TaxID=210409 RepID=A0A5B7ILP3_PORTR|nr:hypothetical protein [Portunus trituberculatus]